MVLHVVERHAPLTQSVPGQHCDVAVHVPPRLRHVASRQMFPEHLPEQHSVGLAHAAPDAPHTGAKHMPPPHIIPAQQSDSERHGAPAPTQRGERHTPLHTPAQQGHEKSQAPPMLAQTMARHAPPVHASAGQHCDVSLHGALSGRQTSARQRLPEQSVEQQSEADSQNVPGDAHV